MSNETSLVASIRKNFDVARAFVARLSRPVRILVGSTGALAAVFVAYLAYAATHEPYSVLFANLEREDAAALVAKLKETKVPYRVQADGTTIEVPEAQVRELRLDLASAGLPHGGGVGFESFDKLRLGASEFEQHVLFRRALEGELGRTIGALGAVQSARVHLVLPEKSVFVTKSEPASASILVKLRPGRSLGPSEVDGVVHLVASSVAGLTADRVALVTTEGVTLHKPRTGSDVANGFDSEGSTQAHALEASLEERARSMLEKLVGPGHVDVRVSADVDLARVERTEDRYDPKSAVLRSEERSFERTAGADDPTTMAGVPGAESNLPTSKPAAKASATPAPAASNAPPATRESHTRNFEVDHVIEKRIATTGTLKRITVAVVLDGVTKTENGKTTNTPRSKEELAKLAGLVKSAVGADDARGDLVTVDSVPFQEIADPFAVAPEPVIAPSVGGWRRWLPAGAASALLIGIAAAAWRKRRRASVAAAAAHQIAATSVPAKLPEEAGNALREAAHTQAARDPATAALVLRAWLGTNTASNHVAERPPAAAS